MKKLFKLSLVIVAIFLVYIFVSLNDGLAQNDKNMDNSASTKEMAERLWELTIQAKGGREKLHSIRNMVESSDGEWKKGSMGTKVHVENLYVFPDKWWSWNDQRPSTFGLSMMMYNWQKGKKYSIQFQGESYKGLEPIESSFNNSSNLAGLIPDLLETKWNQPEPQKTFKGTVGLRTVDIIQTTLHGKRIDFAVDQETHLPLRVISYAGGKPANSVRYADYTEVKGIKMPSKIVFEDSDGEMEYRRTYQFNVEYDENIFKTPPPFMAGPQAWRKN